MDEVILVHHGIKGQRWGVRRYQNPDGTYTAAGLARLGRQNLQKARTANLDKWGSDEKHNIVYIAGYSGSGKSTTALSLSRPGDKVIHLDAYSEPSSGGTATIRNKDFDSYLDKHVPNWRKMTDATKTGENGTMKRHSKEYWDTVDSFREALESYGKVQFANGHRVVAEGVQIADDWLTGDKKYYSDKPMIILGTNPVTSIQRAFERDDRGGLITGLKNLDSAKEYVQWHSNTHKRLDDLATTSNAKKGQDWVKKYLSEKVPNM